MITSTNWRSTMASAVAASSVAVEGDDAAEGRLGIGPVGAVIGLQQVLAVGHATGVGVLDDDAGRAVVELLDALQRRVGVADVVVGQLLALQLAAVATEPRRRSCST
jgi:hypothetical protein